MNRVVRLVGIICAVIAAASSEIARADVPPPLDPSIPRLNKTGDATSHKDEIVGLIGTEIDKLSKDDDSTGQTEARMWLIAEAAGGSDSYRDVYSSVLNDAFTKLLSNNASVRTRVNMGLISESVIKTTRMTTLLPTATTLLSDSSDAVVLLGERASGALLPLLMNGPPKDLEDLLKNMVQAAISHAQSEIGGNIAEETYIFLNPKMMNWAAGGGAMMDFADANLKLQGGRIAMWKGAPLPNSYNDTRATGFLTSMDVWPILPPDKQKAAIQNMLNLIALASRYYLQGNLPNDAMKDLISTIQVEGAYGQELFTKQVADTDLSSVMHDVSQLGRGSQNQRVKEASDSAVQKLQEKYPDLQFPPTQ